MYMQILMLLSQSVQISCLSTTLLVIFSYNCLVFGWSKLLTRSLYTLTFSVMTITTLLNAALFNLHILVGYNHRLKKPLLGFLTLFCHNCFFNNLSILRAIKMYKKRKVGLQVQKLKLYSLGNSNNKVFVWPCVAEDGK